MGKAKKRVTKPADNRKLVLSTLGVIALIAIGFTVKGIVGSTQATGASSVAAQQQGDVQVINMKVSAAGYSPNYVVVKKGIPVKIITDSTEDAGCVRGFMLKALGINQALNVGKDEINFTPTKPGKLAFSCQMQMSTGTVEVI